MLSGRWRQRLRSQIAQHELDPAAALEALMAQAGEEHGRDFYAVLTGFRSYNPVELSGLWLEGDRYRPEQWIAGGPGGSKAGTPRETTPTTPG